MIEEFNSLNFENKKIRDHQKLIEMFMETVLGPENFQRMLLSLDNDAIMGRPKKNINLGRHKRKASGQPPRVPNLNEDQQNVPHSARGFDPKTFKMILEEFDKNKQNVMDQNKIMDDIQTKMLSVAKEFNMKKHPNHDLRLDINHQTPETFHSGSQSHRQMPTSSTPEESNFSNFMPSSGRSSDIRAQAKIEAEILTNRSHMRKRSLPTIIEKDEIKH